MQKRLDHGGGVDTAVAQWGGKRDSWLDLSTGINPVPYPVEGVSNRDWTALPDTKAHAKLIQAAREFWRVPDGIDIVAASGASALIAQMPSLFSGSQVHIPGPTYNEHAAAFQVSGWKVSDDLNVSEGLRVLVHPNNPDGRLWSDADTDNDQIIIDESFADICPDHSLVARAARPGGIVLKSFGKFWGLAGLRLGFAIGHPDTLAGLRNRLGPWAVSGPAYRIGTTALRDLEWAQRARVRLANDATRLDSMMTHHGLKPLGGTSLFRLYDCPSAIDVQSRLAKAHIWSRVFPYSHTWLRLGLPPPDGWDRLNTALQT